MTPAPMTIRPPTDDEILTLWRAGNDTNQIARRFWMPEHQVANRLPRILERDRQDQEWNFDRAAQVAALG